MFMDIARSKLIQVMMLTVSIAGCPAGYTRVTTTGCYRADPRTTWHGNHEDAEARCQESGGTLASLDSQEELDLVIDWLIQQEGKPSFMPLLLHVLEINTVFNWIKSSLGLFKSN